MIFLDVLSDCPSPLGYSDSRESSPDEEELRHSTFLVS